MVTDIYAAGEPVIEGVSGESLAEAIRQHGHKQVYYLPDRAALREFVEDQAEATDLILTLGAGDIYRLGHEMISD